MLKTYVAPTSRLNRPFFRNLRGILLLVFMGVSPSSVAGELISREEALALVFPGAEFKAERIFLTEQQRKEAANLAGTEVPNALIARYLALKEGNLIGYAYVDTHTVRTKKESLLISLDEKGRVKRVEVIVFMEPREYQAPPEWYRQYQGKSLDEELNLQRAIHPLAGATLTSIAANQAVRRVLAIHQVLQGDIHP
ncbi:MAG TPA: FMN-binding protein [Candidatus Limnocylindrales bacterium]|nr:FMN-binding protein [Candidatus Limnocylindrales bacterium]